MAIIPLSSSLFHQQSSISLSKSERTYISNAFLYQCFTLRRYAKYLNAPKKMRKKKLLSSLSSTNHSFLFHLQQQPSFPPPRPMGE